MQLGAKPSMGDVEVVRCGSRAYRNFTDIMDTEREAMLTPPDWDSSWNYDYFGSPDRDGTGSETSYFDHYDNADTSQDTFQIGGVY